MKKLVLASAATAAFCFVNPANAADLAVKAPALVAVPAFNWTGFYVGVDGGYTWGRSTSFQPGSVISFSASPDPRGGIFGVHGGYRYQLDNRFVLGLEGNFDWMDATATAPYFNAAGLPTGNDGELKLKWSAAALGSLGYAWDRFLPYITGGVAFQNLSGCLHVPSGAPCFLGSEFSGTQVGWTVGGGLAYAVTNNIILRAEYLYADYRGKDYSTPSLSGGIVNIKANTGTARVGVSWKFGPM